MVEPELAKPRVFFDVDDTLLAWDKRLRSHAREVVVEAAWMGFEIHIWSGVGARWEVLAVHGLEPYVSGCHIKPLSRHRERLVELRVPCIPDHVVDDDDEIVAVFGGTHLQAPLAPGIPDNELLKVLEDLKQRFPEFVARNAHQRPGSWHI